MTLGGENKIWTDKIKVLALLTIVLAATVGASLVFALQPTRLKPIQLRTILHRMFPQPLFICKFNTAITLLLRLSLVTWALAVQEGLAQNSEDATGGPEGFGQVQVSSDFTANVTNIAKNDTDVSNLLSSRL